MTSFKEKQVDKFLDKIIGEGDDALRVITKLALMNKELTPEIVETIEMMRKQNEEDAKNINAELEMTLDSSGNIVPITYTILSEKVDVIDCGNNVVYRLPLGKT